MVEAARKIVKIAPHAGQCRGEARYGHHDVVASLEEDAQDRWLTWAIEYEATVQELRDAIRAEKEQTPDGGELGSEVGDEARIEFDIDEHGAFRIYEVRLDFGCRRVHLSALGHDARGRHGVVPRGSFGSRGPDQLRATDQTRKRGLS